VLLPIQQKGEGSNANEEKVIGPEVQFRGRNESCASDAREKERHAEKWPQWKESDQPQAGHRYRAFGGAQSGRKGSEKEVRSEDEQHKEVFAQVLGSPMITLRSASCGARRPT
jgi:hypothetical protein